MLGSAVFRPHVIGVARQLRRREPAVHADRRSATAGASRTSTCARYYAEGAKTIRLRDRRAARLAVPAARRLAGGRRHAAAAHRTRASASCARSGWSTASCRRSTRRRPPAARRSFARSTRASSFRIRCKPNTIAKSIAIGNPADGFQVVEDGARRPAAAARRSTTTRSSRRSSCWPRPKASSPSRPAARRWPATTTLIERGVDPARRIGRRLHHRQRLQDRRRDDRAAAAGAHRDRPFARRLRRVPPVGAGKRGTQRVDDSGDARRGGRDAPARGARGIRSSVAGRSSALKRKGSAMSARPGR